MKRDASPPAAVNESFSFVVKNLSKHFGGIQAIVDVSFKITGERILSVIGPNGAGKTTLINLLSGAFPPDSGDILFYGQNLVRLPAYRRASLGICRTFQLEDLFANMTVLENAMVGCHLKGRAGWFSAGLHLRRERREEILITESAYRNLERIGLGKKAHEKVTNLPLGERKLLGIARALGTNPRLLMLDEPAGGLAAHEVARLKDLLRTLLTENDLRILLVEHNVPFVMSVSDRIIVLNYGQKIADDTPENIRNHPRVIEAYLGENSWE